MNLKASYESSAACHISTGCRLGCCTEQKKQNTTQRLYKQAASLGGSSDATLEPPCRGEAKHVGQSPEEPHAICCRATKP